MGGAFIVRFRSCREVSRRICQVNRPVAPVLLPWLVRALRQDRQTNRETTAEDPSTAFGSESHSACLFRPVCLLQEEVFLSQFSKGLSERRLAFIDSNKELWLCPVVSSSAGRGSVPAKHKLHTQVGTASPPRWRALCTVLADQTRLRDIVFLPLSLNFSFGAEGSGFGKPDCTRSNIGTPHSGCRCRWRVRPGTTRATSSQQSPTAASSRGTTPTPWPSTETCWC